MNKTTEHHSEKAGWENENNRIIMNYRLEYNATQGHFHFDRGSHEPNTYGWVTIADDEEDAYLSAFCSYMEERYETKLHRNGKKNLSEKQVKKLWSDYQMIVEALKGYKLIK